MGNDYDVMSWRETGINNWARDCGFVLTQEDGRYNLWSPTTMVRVLDKVGLDEVEGYLETL